MRARYAACSNSLRESARAPAAPVPGPSCCRSARDRRSHRRSPRPRRSATTIRSAASRRRRTRRASRRGRSTCSSIWPTNLFGQPGDRRPACAPATSTPSTRCPTRAGSPTASSRARSRSTRRCAGRTPAPARPPGTWTVIAAKEVGAAPGFTIQDAAGERWFVSFDARGYPEAATGAILVANKIFWTLGYWQVDNVLTHVRPRPGRHRRHRHGAPMSGTVRRMRPSDLDDVWRPRAAVRRRLVPGRRGAQAAGPRRSAGSATTARGPTIPTTSFRTSTAASCAR